MNLRWPESSIEHQSVHRRRSSSSSSASIYIHTCVYKRSRFPQTQDLWRKTASMDYRVGRVSLDAISRWSRSPGCCGYILWCVQCLVGFRFFFVFFTSNAHSLLQVRGNLASCTSLLVMRPFFAFRGKTPLHNEAGPSERSARGL